MGNNEEKREMIEKALGAYRVKGMGDEYVAVLNLVTLAEEAIILPVEVKLEPDEYCPLTQIYYCGPDNWVRDWVVDGLHGKPGKAITIIVPLRE